MVEDLHRPSRQTDIFLGQLGHMHQTMGVEKHYLDYMGPIFCQSIRMVLEEEGEWSMEVCLGVGVTQQGEDISLPLFGLVPG